ncbi:OLC1v1013885C3 [Oldenlandia corymbosa var. corymbosa]|uniref:OLC1v1013885C3 n=1 Tax=Oldenlandia corymbosa var. corymbosa TaxID=529605 RepID=A0AAV1DZT9_OLDCO|nr:OLC1v1013885C3 [Oldenlandia corymbosa var. corymbosa]
MPRKPRLRRRHTRKPTLRFSPFGRLMALLYSSGKRVNLQSVDYEPEEKCAPSTSGNAIVKDGVVEDDGQLSDSSDDGDFEGVVQADFAFFDPKPKDFHGVKVLLQTYLDNKLWDLSGFVDLILEQPSVGTVIQVEGDEDEGIYAVVSALNLGRYKDQKCMLELREYLVKACKEDVPTNLKSLLGERAHEVGLLVSQRVVNLPPQLLPPLYDALFDEVSWATEDEPTEELRKSFQFKTYLMISKIYKHKNADKKIGKNGNVEEAIIYAKPEDEIFHELSSWSINFPLHSQEVKPSELKDYQPMCLVMAVDASKVPTFRKQLHSLIDEA